MWMFFGVFVNTLTVLIGTTVGLFIKKRAGKGAHTVSDGGDKQESLADSLLFCLALCNIFSAASGLIEVKTSAGALICVLSMVIGYVIGYAIRLDDNINRFCAFLISKVSRKEGSESADFARGVVTASLLFCTGSMTILGTLAGASNTGSELVLSAHTLLIIKSILDLISSCCLTVTFGASIYASAAVVLVLEGGLVLLSSFVYPFIEMIGALPALNCVGSLILIALALSLAGIKKVKIGDFLPAIVLSVLFSYVVYLL